MKEFVYAGFWIRAEAIFVDVVLFLVLAVLLLTVIYGPEHGHGNLTLSSSIGILYWHIFSGITIISFWIYKSATPGKLALRLQIVDADTGDKPTIGQFCARYLAYYLAALPLFLGFIWVAMDPRKQGWHDKLAGTVVVRNT